MKKILVTFFVMLMMAASANAAGRKTAIDPMSLPVPAQQLVQQHWPSCVIDNAWIDGKEYEVLLSDGTVIEFDAKGVWKEMKCTDGLPVTLVPVFITRYVVNRYPKILIIGVEKMKGGYEATLANGYEIQFDMRGNVTHVDD